MVVWKDRLRGCVLMAGGVVALLGSAGVSRADYTIEFGFTNSLQEQTIGFSNVSGTTIMGNTNPPPVYDVFVTSQDGTDLRGNGAHVSNNTDNKGPVNWVVFTPQSNYAWTYFDMQLDALNKDVASSVKITVSGNGGTATATLDFPHEGNNGENQHYQVIATNGQWFNRVEVQYLGPDTSGNHEFHNLDVASLQVVPAPPSAVLAGAALLSVGLFRLRRGWANRVAVE